MSWVKNLKICAQSFQHNRDISKRSITLVELMEATLFLDSVDSGKKGYWRIHLLTTNCCAEGGGRGRGRGRGGRKGEEGGGRGRRGGRKMSLVRPLSRTTRGGRFCSMVVDGGLKEGVIIKEMSSILADQ
jgi:hypothetical protein